MYAYILGGSSNEKYPIMTLFMIYDIYCANITALPCFESLWPKFSEIIIYLFDWMSTKCKEKGEGGGTQVYINAYTLFFFFFIVTIFTYTCMNDAAYKQIFLSIV